MLPPERRLGPPQGALPAIPIRNEPADYYETPQITPGTPLKEHLGVLRRHVWLVLGVAALLVGFTAYRVSLERPLYRASAVVRLNDERGAIAGGIGADVAKKQMGGFSTDPVLSQIQVLRSRALAGEVVDKEGLRLQPLDGDFTLGMLRDIAIAPTHAGGDTLRLQFRSDSYSITGPGQAVQAAYGQPVEMAGARFTVASRPRVTSAELMVWPREAAVNAFLGRLDVSNRKGTDVIDVQYTDFDPRVAQLVVNTTAEQFQARNALDAQRESRARRIFVEGQLRETDGQLAAAQRQLANFRSRTRVYSAAGQMMAQQEANLSLQMRREELAANRQVYQSLLGRVQRARPGTGLRALGASPEIAANPVMAGDFQRLGAYEAARDSLTTGPWRRAETHPDVQRLNKLIESSQEKIAGSARAQLEVLNGQLSALDGVRSRSSAQIQELPKAEEEEVFLVQRAEGILKLAQQLREEHQKARIAEEVQVGQVEVVDLASAATPVGSGRFRKLLFALVAGLALGGGGAFLLESMNSSIRRREEIENVLRIPGLAVIPQIASGSGGAGSLLRLRGVRGNGNGNGKALARQTGDGQMGEALVAAAHTHSTGAEAYRTLRTNLIFSQAVQSLKTIVVTSASPGEGKTTTAANLAVTFAQQGMRVLLVDCDLRRARLHKMFNVPREPGLTELILDQEVAAEVIRGTPVENLSVLTSGTLPPNPSELLGGPRMEGVLELLRERFDIIVLDSPPLLAASDASVLGTKTDGVLLVVRAGQTERGAAQQAVQQLAAVGARVVGAVLNDPDAKVPQYGGYYNYEYYGEES
jgi:tyrosine-protein kinase Etk/Wzc